MFVAQLNNLFRNVLVLDVLPLFALVEVVPNLGGGGIKGNFESNSTNKDRGDKDRVLLEEGVVDGAGQTRSRCSRHFIDMESGEK